jgi:acetyl-CoA synthetase
MILQKRHYISYNELHQQVGKMANVLREQGIKKGDRICIYLSIPELAITLACARIGAIHSVVLQDFQHRQYLQELMIANVKWLSHQMVDTVGKTIELKV